MSIIENCKKILEANTFDKFCDIKDKDGKPIIDFKKDFNEFPPETPEQLLGIRQLALVIEPNGDFTEELKNKWRKAYLKCLINEKCDYYFTVYTKECKECKKQNKNTTEENCQGIDRENDIINLMEAWNEKGELFNFLGSKEGVKIYFDVCFRYLLKRYSIINAWKLWIKNKYKSFLSMIFWTFFPLRIIFGILAVFYFSITAKWLWDIILKISESGLAILFWNIFFLGLSILYLWLECFMEIERKGREAFRRALRVTGINFIITAGLALLLINVLNILKYTHNLIGIRIWETLAYASIAMFISMFIQHFWQEKTVPEPF